MAALVIERLVNVATPLTAVTVAVPVAEGGLAGAGVGVDYGIYHFSRMVDCYDEVGDLDEAVDLYKQSIAAYPTAEAHTFLGWTYSFMSLPDQAIEECHRAIEVDPDFGNPYNDIGAYRALTPRPGDVRTTIMQWREAGASWQAGSAKVERLDARSARVTVPGRLTAVGASYTLTYTIYGSGDVIVEGAYQPGNNTLAMMPRFRSSPPRSVKKRETPWRSRSSGPTKIFAVFPDLPTVMVGGCSSRSNASGISPSSRCRHSWSCSR